jgi:hypothetical protein
MKRAIASTVMIVLVFAVGCLGGGSYKIVAMTHYTEQRNGEDVDMIAFVIRDDGTTIKAHCQATIQNKCTRLLVGQSYEFKREMPQNYLSLADFHVGTATLAVEAESIDK